MEPGRELDALIAREIMGESDTKENLMVWAPQYSTSIEAAWEVVEKMKELCFILSKIGDDWECELDSNDGKFLQSGSSCHVFATGKNAPHAICLAALKAKGIEI